MATFKVLCRVDAFADYVATVRAKSPEEAAQLARDNASTFRWEALGTQEFEPRLYVALAPDGSEIEETQCGGFF
jgi:hypothetical protein